MIDVFKSHSGQSRLDAAKRFVEAQADTPAILLGPQREVVDDFARNLLRGRGAQFGLHRYSWGQLVSDLASAESAKRGIAQATALGEEALAARSAFEAHELGKLGGLQNVIRLPGFARAALSTLAQLRLAKLPANTIRETDAARDLAELLGIYEQELERARLADRARRMSLALHALRHAPGPAFLRGRILLLDLPIHHVLERELIEEICRGATQAFCTVPLGDRKTLEHLAHITAAEGTTQSSEPAASSGVSANSLGRLRAFLFSQDPPTKSSGDESVTFFSAPGEARECIEIARRVLQAAKTGVSFDDMAVFLRAPQLYSAHLDTAFRRADVPAYFARGTKRPDPAGRAFLALLSCCSEGLSAKRFAEYLSFAQVPDLDEAGAPPAHREFWIGAEDEAFGKTGAAAVRNRQVEDEREWVQGDLFAPSPVRFESRKPTETASSRPQPEESAASGAEPDRDKTPALSGSLKTPWKWEELLVEAAVIGGKERWRRRLTGLAKELELKVQESAREDRESPRVKYLEREIVHLGHLERFALPVIEALDALPQKTTWGEWVRALSRLAPMVLRQPERVLAILAELRPMSDVGPISINEIREVLTPSLSDLELDPPPRRYGRVFVGTPEHARGRSFSCVFIPALAERLFPQRLRDDPLLLDKVRKELSEDLHVQEDRGQQERLLLHLGVGAARDRLILSYPRVDSVEARPRVPSFYGLDIIRATRGEIPDYQVFEREAADVAKARLAWPAPTDPDVAIDVVEHDLAVLGPLLFSRTSKDVRGRANYLLQLNDKLARSLRARYQRWKPSWSPQDGLIRSTASIEKALSAQRLSERPYSATALQKFSVCPYRFYLSAILRLEQRQDPVALVQLDPLTRGRIFHHIQADTLRSLQKASLLPLAASQLRKAETHLDSVLTRLSGEYDEMLAPAIPRVWQDEMESMRADLRVWLRRMTEKPVYPPTTHALETSKPWKPKHFELTFGLPADPGHDPSSIPEPLTLPGNWKLRGAIDLVEESAAVLNPFSSSFLSLSEAAANLFERTPTTTDRKHAADDDPEVDGDETLPEIPVLRVTDHKTGVNRTNEGMITGGGEVLQPVLYSMAVEQLLQRPVAEGRLYFCTSKGGFSERIIPMDNRARDYGGRVLEIINRAVVHGWLMPIPKPGACNWCDFRSVCGPHEETRSHRKNPHSYRDLEELRDVT